MTDTAPVLLYDLPSPEPCRSWSGNVWKTRYALNYKGIPYKTEWLPYTRLADTLKSLNIPPNPEGSWSAYSVPTVRFPDTTHVMDSAAIATELETRYPSTPSLHLNPTLEKEAQAAMGPVFMSLIPVLLPASKTLVAPEDQEWFRADRAARFNMSIEDAFDSEKDTSAAFEAAKPAFEGVRTFLGKYKVDEGPFILGSQVCYADFVIAATVQMLNRAGGKTWEEFVKYAPRELIALHEGCGEWAVRQD